MLQYVLYLYAAFYFFSLGLEWNTIWPTDFENKKIQAVCKIIKHFFVAPLAFILVIFICVGGCVVGCCDLVAKLQKKDEPKRNYRCLTIWLDP